MTKIKHILVLTDFSSCSLDGISTAKVLADTVGCKISILHAYRLLPDLVSTENSSGKSLKEKIEKSIKEKTESLESKYFAEQTRTVERAVRAQLRCYPAYRLVSVKSSWLNVNIMAAPGLHR